MRGSFGLVRKPLLAIRLWCWRKAVQACRDFVKENPEYDIRIVFAVLDDKIMDVGERTIEEIWD